MKVSLVSDRILIQGVKWARFYVGDWNLLITRVLDFLIQTSFSAVIGGKTKKKKTNPTLN